MFHMKQSDNDRFVSLVREREIEAHRRAIAKIDTEIEALSRRKATIESLIAELQP
jgi:hypothetical protein